MVKKLFKFCFNLFFAAIPFCLILGVGVLYYFGRSLPDYNQLAKYEPPVVTRLHAGDGRLFAEYASEHRVFVPFEAIPSHVVDAFLAAEDSNFYSHFGVDIPGLIRSIVVNIKNLGTGRRLVGGSTITQQVAKNFLLTSERTFVRKIKEAILSFRIERAYSKNRILELYLNEIFLGSRSYGVAAAALNYFGKALSELTVEEAAFLAALPKAPSRYNPKKYPERATQRRNYVLERMYEANMITEEELEFSKRQQIELRSPHDREVIHAKSFAEEVRRELLKSYGEEVLYKGGLTVRTTLDSKLQKIAERVLSRAILSYDRRHGWRGPITNIALDDYYAQLDQEERASYWVEPLSVLNVQEKVAGWRVAVVLSVEEQRAFIGFKDGEKGYIPLSEMVWARAYLKNSEGLPIVGGPVGSAEQVLRRGDVIFVRPIREEAGLTRCGLRQIPQVNGAIVVLDPHTGRVLAVDGGAAYKESQFNRATQAMRQVGSAIKPFVFLTALENGMAPNTIVNDAPVVINQGEELGVWKPQNISKQFYGRIPLRMALEKSYNVATVRVAQSVGMRRVVDTFKKFGISDNTPPVLSMSIGAGETTLLRLTAAYAMLANGGKRITPSFIDRIQNRHGKTIYKLDQRSNEKCFELGEEDEPPEIPDAREQVSDPRYVYQITSILEGAVKNGTGRLSRVDGYAMAGKSGTSNEYKDTWFVGFTPNLVVGVYIGFDTPTPMGRGETGGRLTAPVVKHFFSEALKDKPSVPFKVPEGIRFIRINKKNGNLAASRDKDVMVEAFVEGREPKDKRNVSYEFDPEKLDGTESIFSESSGDQGNKSLSGIY